MKSPNPNARIHLSSFLACLLLALLTATAPAQSPTPSATPAGVVDPADPVKEVEPPLTWHELRTWGVEGRALEEDSRLRYFDRLPASAEAKASAKVWELSRHSAGMISYFRTDAETIWVRYNLLKSYLTGPNKTAIASSGIDLYARDASGKWRWAGINRPQTQDIRLSVLKEIAPGMREYALYLPLFNGVDDAIAIGVPPEAKFEPIAPRTEKPVVFYGTSITHGASASRPGMNHVAILGRRLNRPIVNLGFAGNGRMDDFLHEYLTRIDAAAFVIDCAPNMNAAQIDERCVPLVKALRAAHPNMPIVLVEDRRNANAWLLPKREAHHTANHAAMKKAFETLKKEGVEKLYYIPGDDLIGHDAEATTDGSHPSDLGFVRQADIFEPVLREALGQ